jgi:hypothetical protein
MCNLVRGPSIDASYPASSLFITPHTKIILAAFPPDFMGLFVPPSHYIPNRKKINKNKERKNGDSVWQVH